MTMRKPAAQELTRAIQEGCDQSGDQAALIHTLLDHMTKYQILRALTALKAGAPETLPLSVAEAVDRCLGYEYEQ